MPASPSAEQIFHHYQHQMLSLRKERFHILLLGSKNRIMREIMASEGSPRPP